MSKHGKISFDQNELAASLVPLGIREITERMEVSPLLVDQGDLIQAGAQGLERIYVTAEDNAAAEIAVGGAV